jgi:hypothetical protein
MIGARIAVIVCTPPLRYAIRLDFYPFEVSAFYFSLQMQIEEIDNPFEALILAMLLPGIAHVAPQRESMLDAFENLDLIPMLSLVHYVDGSAPVLLLERDIVRGAGQEERVFLGELIRVRTLI